MTDMPSRKIIVVQASRLPRKQARRLHHNRRRCPNSVRPDA